MLMLPGSEGKEQDSPLHFNEDGRLIRGKNVDKSAPNNHSVLVTGSIEGLLCHLNVSPLLIEINGKL